MAWRGGGGGGGVNQSEAKQKNIQKQKQTKQHTQTTPPPKKKQKKQHPQNKQTNKENHSVACIRTFMNRFGPSLAWWPWSSMKVTGIEIAKTSATVISHSS